MTTATARTFDVIALGDIEPGPETTADVSRSTSGVTSTSAGSASGPTAR